MEISGKKKITTIIGVAAEEAQKLKASADRLEKLRAFWSQHNPDPSGTPLEGNVQALSAWVDAVRAVADNAVANALVTHAVPSHRNMAFGEEI